MSTKVYEGRKLDTANIAKINETFNKINDEVMVVSRELIAKQIAHLFAKAYDFKLTGDELVTNMSFDDEDEKELKKRVYGSKRLIHFLLDVMHYRQKRIWKTNLRDPMYDFQLEINIYPLNNRKTLFCPIFEHKEYRDIIDKYLDEYGYWNNVDPLETVSAREWNQRREDWDKVLDYDYHYWKWVNFDGYNYPYNPFHPEHMDILVTNIIRFFPKRSDRGYALARADLMKKYMDDYLPKEREDLPISEYWKAEKQLLKDKVDELEELKADYISKMTRMTAKKIREFKIEEVKEIENV